MLWLIDFAHTRLDNPFTDAAHLVIAPTSLMPYLADT